MNYRYFLLKCPHCGNSMKYMTADSIKTLSKKRKRCVYCGKSFKVDASIISETNP